MNLNIGLNRPLMALWRPGSLGSKLDSQIPVCFKGLIRPLMGLIRPSKGLIRPFKGLIRPLKGLIRPLKGLIRLLKGHKAVS